MSHLKRSESDFGVHPLSPYVKSGTEHKMTSDLPAERDLADDELGHDVFPLDKGEQYGHLSFSSAHLGGLDASIADDVATLDAPRVT